MGSEIAKEDTTAAIKAINSGLEALNLGERAEKNKNPVKQSQEDLQEYAEASAKSGEKRWAVKGAKATCTRTKGDTLKTMGGIVPLIPVSLLSELTKQETRLTNGGKFKSCSYKYDEICPGADIEDGVWKAVDESIEMGSGERLRVDVDNSYMGCIEGFGIIYLVDSGQPPANADEIAENMLEKCIDEYIKTNGVKINTFQDRVKQVNFLNSILRKAISEQMRTGTPWQVTLAQAAYETGWGAKTPIDIYNGTDSKNLFGIKFTGEPTDDRSLFVKAFTEEVISKKDLQYWEKEHNRWAEKGEQLGVLKEENGKLRISVIQPFKIFGSKEDSIEGHSNVFASPQYGAAKPYQSEPYKFLGKIISIYATDLTYYENAASIMNKYLEWDGKLAGKNL